MAIDSIALVLIGPTAPIYKENTVGMTATATTKLSGSNTDATQVEFELLFAQFGGIGLVQNIGLMDVVARSTVSVSTATGVYNNVFTPSQFSKPGWYKIQAKGIVSSGSPLVINTFLVAESALFQVLDQNQADEKNVFTDTDKSEVENPNFTVWQQVTLTGAAVKAATGVNSGASKTVTVSNIPAGSVMVGGILNVTVADAGAASTTTATLGTNSTAFNGVLGATDLRTVAKTGVSASFVPLLASGTAVKTVITVTGSSKTIADIDDASAWTFYFGYSVPKLATLGV